MSPSKSHQKILFALCQWRVVGIEQPERDLVAILSGYGKKKEGFKKNLSQLNKNGWIIFTSTTTMSLTELGLAMAGGENNGCTTSLSNETMQHFIRKELLKPSEIKIFNYLLDGDIYSRSVVATSTGYECKPEGFKKTLSNMKKMKVCTLHFC